MGLYDKYEFPHMYTSPELDAATKKLVEHARKNNVILGLFLFGTARVGEFLEKGFTFISIGNDLHHVLTQAGAYVNDMEKIAARKRQVLEAPPHRAVLKVVEKPEGAPFFSRTLCDESGDFDFPLCSSVTSVVSSFFRK